MLRSPVLQDVCVVGKDSGRCAWLCNHELIRVFYVTPRPKKWTAVGIAKKKRSRKTSFGDHSLGPFSNIKNDPILVPSAFYPSGVRC